MLRIYGSSMHITRKSRLWTAGYSTWLVSDTAFELSGALASFGQAAGQRSRSVDYRLTKSNPL